MTTRVSVQNHDINVLYRPLLASRLAEIVRLVRLARSVRTLTLLNALERMSQP